MSLQEKGRRRIELSETDTKIWFCLNPECKKVMDDKDMKYLNKHGRCPYCWCSLFRVKIYEEIGS